MIHRKIVTVETTVVLRYSFIPVLTSDILPLALLLQHVSYRSTHYDFCNFIYYRYVYRFGSQPLSSKFYDELMNVFKIIVIFASSLLIVGDFNIHIDDTNVPGKQLGDLFDLLSFVQHVKQSTQVHGHTLDLIITIADTRASNRLIDPPYYSDHSVISCKFPFYCKPLRVKKSLNHVGAGSTLISMILEY